MEEGKKAHDSWFGYESQLKNKDEWVKVEDDSSHEHSMVSSGSSVSFTSCDTADDASSSSNSLYDLSELMLQLPIKRGLSKFYQGRSESFTSLSRVTSVEDLAKKTTPFTKKMKSCENGLNNGYKPYILPKPLISKTNKHSTYKRSLAPLHNKKMEC